MSMGHLNTGLVVVVDEKGMLVGNMIMSRTDQGYPGFGEVCKQCTISECNPFDYRYLQHATSHVCLVLLVF